MDDRANIPAAPTKSGDSQHPGGTKPDMQSSETRRPDPPPPPTRVEGIPVPRPALPPEPSGVLLLPSDHYSFTQSARRIFGELAKTENLFTRGGRVVELIETSHGPELSVLLPAAFQSRLDRSDGLVMSHVVIDNNVCLKPKRCPRQTAEVLLETREARELLPPIACLAPAPVLLDTGSDPALLGPGYHRQGGGILVTGGDLPPTIEVEHAVSDLANLLRDFDFQTPADRSRALGMLITPALKLGGFLTVPTPIDVAEADQSQSGKTYRQVITRAVYREPGYTVARREGGVGSLDESIGAALLSGRTFIVADNLRGALNSQYLEAIITSADGVAVRVPHRGEVMVDARRVTFSITSNGVETTRDLANRSCLVRIRKRPHGYTWHPWPEGSLHEHVETNQAHYLGCVHAVVRHWVAAGRPRTANPAHDMRHWAGVLDWIVRNIFDAAPLLDGHRKAQERVSNPALVWLRALCLAVEQDGQLSTGLSATDLWALSQDRQIPLPGANLAIDDKAARQLIGRLFTGCFRDTEKNTLTLDGYVIRRTECQERDEKKRCNRTVKRYSFFRADAPSMPPKV